MLYGHFEEARRGPDEDIKIGEISKQGFDAVMRYEIK